MHVDINLCQFVQLRLGQLELLFGHFRMGGQRHVHHQIRGQRLRRYGTLDTRLNRRRHAGGGGGHHRALLLFDKVSGGVASVDQCLFGAQLNGRRCVVL